MTDRAVKLVLVFTALLGMLIMMVSRAEAETLYVRPKPGDYGAKDGTSYETAFDGLASILWGDGVGKVGAGDTLYVCGTFSRTTENDRLLVGADGAAGSPITIRGDYVGDAGIIIGAFLYTAATWVANGDGTFYIDEPSPAVGSSSIYSEAWEGTVGGTEYNLEPKTSQVAVAGADGSFWNDTSIHRYWYNPHGDSARDVYHRYSNCILNQAHDYITYTNLTLYASAPDGVCILTEGAQQLSEHVTVQNCTFKYATSVAIRSHAVDYLTVQDNTFSECFCAIYLYDGDYSTDKRTNVVIQRNTIDGGDQGVGVWTWSPSTITGEDTGGILGFPNENWTITRNVITNIQGSAIYSYLMWTDELATNFSVTYNQITDVAGRLGYGKGIYLGGNNGTHDEAYSGAVIAYNIIDTVTGSQPAEPGSNNTSAGIMLMPADPADSANRVRIYGNTVTNTWLNYMFRLRNSGGAYRTAFILDNNISYEPQTGGWHLWTTSDFQVFDCEIKNNCWYPDTAGGNDQFTWDGGLCTNFADFSADAVAAGATAPTSGSTTADPTFVNAVADDYSLQASSPCVDTGANLGATYDDAINPTSVWPSAVTTLDQEDNGSGWEIGAFGYYDPVAVEKLMLILN